MSISASSIEVFIFCFLNPELVTKFLARLMAILYTHVKKALSPLNVSSCCQTLMKVCCDKSSESSFDLIKEKIEA